MKVSTPQFSYLCQYTNQTINETIAYISEGLIVCESAACYDQSFVESCGVIFFPEIEPKTEEDLLLEEIAAKGLTEVYEAALPVSYAPLSSQGYNAAEKTAIREAYSTLQNGGFRFVCGMLSRTK